MQKDFHYYVIGMLARMTGFGDEEATVVSCASQYVDDNTDRYYVASDTSGDFLVGFPEKVEFGGKTHKFIVTQSDDVLAWVKKTVQRRVYAPFHFMPGGGDVIAGRKNALSTTRNSANARRLLDEALGSRDPYAIGIGLHVYADTWSHEHFSGFDEEWNRSAENPLPSIGHAKAVHSPDQISLTWNDIRLGYVDNRERAIEAMECIFGYLKTYMNSGVTWDDVKKDCTAVVSAADHNKRVDAVRALYPLLRSYDEYAWINGAFSFERDPADVWDHDGAVGGITRPRVVTTTPRPGLLSSDWFLFQRAAKRHLSSVLKTVGGLK